MDVALSTTGLERNQQNGCGKDGCGMNGLIRTH
jgi:hypothetical protein